MLAQRVDHRHGISQSKSHRREKPQCLERFCGLDYSEHHVLHLTFKGTEGSRELGVRILTEGFKDVNQASAEVAVRPHHVT